MEPDETQCLAPLVSNLLEHPVGNEVNIEEGLCKPKDENLFLLSSIAFLQKQLIRKLENQTASQRSVDINRKYSDLLLVESGQKYRRQKCFIRLPNMEKFDEVLKSEASLPQKVLSHTQILPLPKKNKSNRLSISNIFKQRVNIDTEIPRKTHSVFNIFRKSSTSTDVSDTNLSLINSIVHINPEECMIIKDEEYDMFHSGTSSGSMSSLRLCTQKSSSRNNSKEDTEATYPHKSRGLSDIEEEILKVIPTKTNLEIKRSINQKLRVSKGLPSLSSLSSYSSLSDVKFIKKEDDFLEDPQTGIKFKCVPNTQTKRRRIREQQSKLSVCMEDEPESDFEMYPQQRNYPFNCTDDVKAMVSSETIDVIMSELLYQLEEHIQQ